MSASPTSQAVTPTESRKCPTCGTKLIPASQAFSEIRERITAEEPPADLFADYQAWCDQRGYQKPIAALRKYVASLSSQLECAIKERKFAASSALLLDDQFKQVCAELESERSQLERLKAEQMEPDEAQHALDQIPDNQCGWPPKDCPVCDSLREKLRRQSDTGAHP